MAALYLYFFYVFFGAGFNLKLKKLDLYQKLLIDDYINRLLFLKGDTSEEQSASARNAWNAKQWLSQAQRVESEELWHLKLRREVRTL